MHQRSLSPSNLSIPSTPPRASNMWDGKWRMGCSTLASSSATGSCPDGCQHAPAVVKHHRLAEGSMALKVGSIDHGDHQHEALMDPSRATSGSLGIKAKKEGCPCCGNNMDFDEFLSVRESFVNHGAHSHDIFGGPADFSSANHWVAFGAGGFFSALGLTASYRNIKGTISNRKDLNQAIRDIKQRIREVEASPEAVPEDVTKLKAMLRGIHYSRFDTCWNMMVPGVINGAGSTAILSTGVWSHPFALPIIQLYAILQTGRNAYDTVRFWNRYLTPPSQNIAANQNKPHILSGIKKINRITLRKRIFFPSNALGFATFFTGAFLVFLSLPTVAVFGTGLATALLGILLLSAGALFTGVTNNVWTNKFRPRNSDIGLNRESAELEDYVQAVGERRALKRILIDSTNNLFKAHQRTYRQFKIRRIGWQLAGPFPFMNDIALRRTNQVRLDMIKFLNDQDTDMATHREDIVKHLLEKALPTRLGIASKHPKLTSSFVRVCHGLKELGMLEHVFKNYFLEYHEPTAQAEIDEKPLHKCSECSSTTSLDLELKNLFGFQKKGSEWHFNPYQFERGNKREVVDRFKRAIDLTFITEVDILRYQQYGAEAAYWNLASQKKLAPTLSISRKSFLSRLSKKPSTC